MAYQSSAVQVINRVVTSNSRSAIWIYDTDAELISSSGLDNPNRTFYPSWGRVRMSDNVASGGAYDAAFNFADGYTASTYTLSDNLAEHVISADYLFAPGLEGIVWPGPGEPAWERAFFAA